METKDLSPKNGMAVTKHFYCDTQAGIITAVYSPTKIEVHYFNFPTWGEDRVVDVKHEPLPTMSSRDIWSLRKSGVWRQVGRPDRWGECWLGFGAAHNYRCMEY